MIYLVGVSHSVQHRGPNMHYTDIHLKVVDQFTEYLIQIIAERQIKLVAEEFSKEAVEKNQVSASTAEILCKSIGVKHCFCDPDSQTRTELSITSDEEREKYWMGKLGCEASEQNTIFICGENHLNSFNTLLIQSDYDAVILSCGWGKEYEESFNNKTVVYG